MIEDDEQEEEEEDDDNEVICERCAGSGEGVTGEGNCCVCHGSGVIKYLSEKYSSAAWDYDDCDNDRI